LRRLKETNKGMDKINKGTYWTPLEKLYEPKAESYENGYKAICLRMTNTEWQRPQDYQHIIDDLRAEVQQNDTASDISMNSKSSALKDPRLVASSSNNIRSHG
jgi:ubiquitin-protein ligase